MFSRPPQIVWTGWIAVILLSIALGITSTLRKNLQLSRPRVALIALTSATHFALCSLQTVTWVFFAPQKLDWIFMALHLGRLLSYAWSECVLNFAEKKLMDGSYVLNSRPYDEPYIDGLPLFFRYLYIFVILIVAPVVLYVIFADARNYFGVLKFLSPWAVYVAAAVTLVSLSFSVRFAMTKMSRILPRDG